MALAGVRRRLLLVGDDATLDDLERPLRATHGGIGVEVVGRLAVDAGARGLAGSLDRLAVLLEAERPDELVLAEAHFDEQTVLEVVQLAHRHGVKVKLAPSTTELLVHEGEYVPGQGIPLFELRPPMLTGLEWATKRVFDIVVSLLFLVVGIPLWLVVAAAIKLESRGPVLYVDRRIGVARAGVRDAQVPDDGRRCRGAAGRAGGRERGVGRALQDPRRPARDPGRPGAAAALARRAPAARGTCSAGR